MKLPRWLSWIIKHLSFDPKPGGGVVNYQWTREIGGKKPEKGKKG